MFNTRQWGKDRVIERYPKLEVMCLFGLVVRLLALSLQVVSSNPQGDKSFYRGISKGEEEGMMWRRC